MVHRMPHVIRALVLAIAGVALAGCGWPYTSGGSSSSSGSSSGGTATAPAGDAPILQAANMVASVAPANGLYTISGLLTYSCDDDVVETVRVTVYIVGQSYNYPANGMENAYGWPFTFTLVDDVPYQPGPLDYEITLITKGGVQSTPTQETVTLQ
jgi:hypothetical protein